MGQQYKRRIYLIDRTFQLKFVRLFVGIMCVLTVIVGAVSYQVLGQIVERHLYSPHISALSSGELLRPALLWINCIFTGVFLVVSVAYIYIYLRRVTGSLKRFATHLAEMRGRLVPKTIHFRQNDPLHLVAHDFNTMAGHLEKKITTTRGLLQQALHEIHDFRVSRGAESQISSENFKNVHRHLVAAEKELKG